MNRKGLDTDRTPARRQTRREGGDRGKEGRMKDEETGGQRKGEIIVIVIRRCLTPLLSI